jgi:hypothetical protein
MFQLEYEEPARIILSKQLACFSLIPALDQYGMQVGSMVAIASSESPQAHIRPLGPVLKLKKERKQGKEFQVKTSNSSQNKFGLGAFNICLSAVKELRGVLSVALTSRESFTSSATMEDVETAVEKAFNDLVQTNGMKQHLKGRRIMFGVINKVHTGNIQIAFSQQKRKKIQAQVKTGSMTLMGLVAFDETGNLLYEGQGIVGIEMVAFVATATKDDGSAWEVSKGIPVLRLNSEQFEQALCWLKHGESPGKTICRASRLVKFVPGIHETDARCLTVTKPDTLCTCNVKVSPTPKRPTSTWYAFELVVIMVSCMICWHVSTEYLFPYQSPCHATG